MYNDFSRGEIMLTFDKVFEDYVRAGAVPPGGFGKEDLQGANQHKKVQAIKQIFELAEHTVVDDAEILFLFRCVKVRQHLFKLLYTGNAGNGAAYLGMAEYIADALHGSQLQNVTKMTSAATLENTACGKGLHGNDADAHLFAQLIKLLLGGVSGAVLLIKSPAAQTAHMIIADVLGQHVEDGIDGEHEHVYLAGFDRSHGGAGVMAGKADEAGLALSLQLGGIFVHPAVEDAVKIFKLIAVVHEQHIHIVRVHDFIIVFHKLAAKRLVAGADVLAADVNTAKVAGEINLLASVLDGAADAGSGVGGAHEKIYILYAGIKGGGDNVPDGSLRLKPDVFAAKADGTDHHAGISQFTVFHVLLPFKCHCATLYAIITK